MRLYGEIIPSLEHGLCGGTVDYPLAKARGLSLRTDAQTMFYLSLIPPRPHNLPTCGSLVSKFIQSFQAFEDEIAKRKKSLEQIDREEPCLIEQPQWLCEWKVDIVGETEEEIEEFVKMINTTII